MHFDLSKANIESLAFDLFTKKQVSVSVLRLDKIHPLVSGNKIFKLQCFLDQSLQSSNKTILSFGGAYSNHLAALAFACKTLQIKSIGIVRGEKPSLLSPTLQLCTHNGMQLKFISRDQYSTKDTPAFIQDLQTEFGECIIIPEGGFHPLGVKGASQITDLIPSNTYSHICSAVGTATSLAGIYSAAEKNQTIIGIPVLKGLLDLKDRFKQLLDIFPTDTLLEVFDDYHFGGYAKKTEELIVFMNWCWEEFSLPLDFVYTAKMFYGVVDKISKNHFAPNSHILCIHTGGLQGNNSLPLNSLKF